MSLPKEANGVKPKTVVKKPGQSKTEPTVTTLRVLKTRPKTAATKTVTKPTSPRITRRTTPPLPVAIIPLAQGYAAAPQNTTARAAAAAKITTILRVAGSSLVVLGTCLTLTASLGVLASFTQSALLIEATTASSTIDTVATTTITCSSGTVLVVGECINPKPPVTFSVAGDNVQLQGIVSVHVAVANADRVKLSVYNTDTSTPTEVGPMVKSTDGNFALDWDTTTVDDGEYILQALVENQSATYEAADTTQKLTVENHPQAVVANTTPVTTTTNTSDVLTAPILTSNIPASATEFRLAITVRGAETVRLYARLLPDGIPRLLGSAYRETDTEWRYRWQLGDLPVGQYGVNAEIVRTDGSYVNTASVVLKKLAPEGTTISPTPAPLAVKPIFVADPVVRASISPLAPVHGLAQLQVRVDGADSVTLYLLGSNTLVKTALGRATSVDTNVWTFSFNSTTVPDGDYTLVANISNAYGSYENRPLTFTVRNRVDPVLTSEQQAKITLLHDTALTVSPLYSPVRPASVVKPLTKSTPLATGTLAFIEDAVDAAITPELQKLAIALRLGNTLKIAGIKANIQSLTIQIVSRSSSSGTSAEITKLIQLYVSRAITRTENNVATIDKIVSERTGEKASLDSDHDGVPDFDEVTIYKTNPFRADTDNDGFIDGAEIQSGYDPLDAKKQALVAYESPRETGLEQKELLAITSITTATTSAALTAVATNTVATTTTAQLPVAIISGIAPANSFVTLYIFSTPIVITIKTDTDGGWNYYFDQELENGAHEIYVGVTDNAGKIVAKSAPFSFVKTAEAYTAEKDVTDAAATPAPPAPRNMLSSAMVYILLGLSVLCIGFLLLLIGVKVEVRRQHVNLIRA